MEVDWYYRLILLIILLILSAFFSGSEVALFSLDKNKIKELKKTPGIIAKYITSLLEAPRRLLVTILLGNTIINVGASILAVTIALDAAVIFDISGLANVPIGPFQNFYTRVGNTPFFHGFPGHVHAVRKQGTHRRFNIDDGSLSLEGVGQLHPNGECGLGKLFTADGDEEFHGVNIEF